MIGFIYLVEKKTILKLNCMVLSNYQSKFVLEKCAQLAANLACRNLAKDVKNGINQSDLVCQKYSSCVKNWVVLL